MGYASHSIYLNILKDVYQKINRELKCNLFFTRFNILDYFYKLTTIINSFCGQNILDTVGWFNNLPYLTPLQNLIYETSISCK